MSAPHDPTTSTPATAVVHVAVHDGLADWEVGHLTSRINNPEWQAHPGRFATRTVAATTAPITTMGGLRVVPHLTFEELRPADSAMLVLPGASSWDTDPSAHDAATATARTFLDEGVPVAAICGAVAGLARAGLLDDRAHTGAAREYLLYGTGYAGGDGYRDEDVVNDRGLITAGPVHPVEFAREVFAQLDLYAPDILDAWYRLFGEHDASAYPVLAAAA